LLWNVVRWTSAFIGFAVFRFRAFRQERVPKRGGVLIVANHQSYLDPVIVAIALHRSSSFMARSTLFVNPFFGAVISALNAFPVVRGGRDLQAVRDAVRRLERGECLVVFPEGTRTTDGRIGALQPGVLAIADRAGVPIVPAVVDGAFEAWPKGRGIRPWPVRVIYGAPVPHAERQGAARDEVIARLHAEMVRLQAELRRIGT
jgi:1-acyl-sn-glycerol-3-phosphate acyltransferase